MKRAAIFACAAASIHALTAPPQLQDLKSNLKLKLRKQQLLRATASQNVTTPRRYASRAELKDTLISELQPNPFHWTEWPFRIGSLGAFYLSYPLAWQAVSVLPPPNPTEGGYFFSLMSIVFGTLTASTISDATARLAALRAAAVEECTLMLPLIKRLEVILVLDSDAPERGDDVFRAVARRLHLCGNQPVSYVNASTAWSANLISTQVSTLIVATSSAAAGNGNSSSSPKGTTPTPRSSRSCSKRNAPISTIWTLRWTGAVV